MNSNEDIKRVTTTYTMSNGRSYVVVENMRSADLRRARGNARALAHSTEAIIINVVDGSVDYLNPRQVVSINIEAPDHWTVNGVSGDGKAVMDEALR